MHRRLFLSIVAIGLSSAAFAPAALVQPALAQPAVAPERATLSVREAHEQAKAGKLLLIDIRRPDEWRDTGVPEGAIPLDMTSSVFEARLTMLRLENPGKPVALICRTASRSRQLQQTLLQRGHREVIDVRGGMLGDGRNRGWLDEGLPLTR